MQNGVTNELLEDGKRIVRLRDFDRAGPELSGRLDVGFQFLFKSPDQFGERPTESRRISYRVG